MNKYNGKGQSEPGALCVHSAQVNLRDLKCGFLHKGLSSEYSFCTFSLLVGTQWEHTLTV